MTKGKEEHGEPLIAIQTTRTVRVYAITEQEAKSMDQQYLMAGATVSFGTFFFGMFADMLIGVSPVDWRLATAFVVVSISSWLFGGWFLWARRSLLKTVRSESGVLAAGSPTVAVKIGSQG